MTARHPLARARAEGAQLTGLTPRLNQFDNWLPELFQVWRFGDVHLGHLLEEQEGIREEEATSTSVRHHPMAHEAVPSQSLIRLKPHYSTDRASVWVKRRAEGLRVPSRSVRMQHRPASDKALALLPT